MKIPIKYICKVMARHTFGQCNNILAITANEGEYECRYREKCHKIGLSNLHPNKVEMEEYLFYLLGKNWFIKRRINKIKKVIVYNYIKGEK